MRITNKILRFAILLGCRDQACRYDEGWVVGHKASVKRLGSRVKLLHLQPEVWSWTSSGALASMLPSMYFLIRTKTALRLGPCCPHSVGRTSHGAQIFRDRMQTLGSRGHAKPNARKCTFYLRIRSGQPVKPSVQRHGLTGALLSRDRALGEGDSNAIRFGKESVETRCETMVLNV